MEGGEGDNLKILYCLLVHTTSSFSTLFCYGMTTRSTPSTNIKGVLDRVTLVWRVVVPLYVPLHVRTLRCGPKVKPNILQRPPWKTHELRSYSVKDHEILIVNVRIEELKLSIFKLCY